MTTIKPDKAHMQQAFSYGSSSILHELDLGHHTLFIYEDGSIDLLANNDDAPYVADFVLRLDSDETHRLFVSLHEQFCPQSGCEESDPPIKQGPIMHRFPEAPAAFPIGPLYVPATEPSVHNAAGFCTDPSCPCKEDRELIGALDQQYQDGEISAEELSILYAGA